MKKISAPGSVFITGEYLILLDQPALVSAVNRYASVEIDPTRDHYFVEGLDNTDMQLPLAVCKVLGLSPTILNNLRASVTQLQSKEGTKYGLSSSAASCVALVRLLSPQLTVQDLAIKAGLAHRLFQNGKGSNADVQLAAMGGTAIVYQQKESMINAECVQIPSQIRCVPVWLSSPAKTLSFITRFNEAKKNSKFYTDILTPMIENNLNVIEACKMSEADRFLVALRRQDAFLYTLGKYIEAPIHTSTHRKLVAHCSAPFVAKVSGSGGGDISLIFGPKSADWNSLLSKIPKGIERLDLELEASTVL